jgi:hypothetical protein
MTLDRNIITIPPVVDDFDYVFPIFDDFFQRFPDYNFDNPITFEREDNLYRLN